MGASMMSVKFTPCPEATQGIKDAVERIDIQIQ
jgi:hypothetical protein